MKNEIRLIISKEDKSINPSRITKQYWENNHKEIFLEIDSLIGESFTERLFNYMNDIVEIPICKNCSNGVKFQSFIRGYSSFCSKRCSNIYNGNLRIENGIKIDNNQEKIKKTLKERYGSENYNNREKAQKTMLDRYGYKTSGESPELFQKAKNTNLDKYGSEYTWQIKEIKEKSRKTLKERYGVNSPLDLVNRENLVDKIKKSRLETFEKKYSDEYEVIVNDDNLLTIKGHCNIHEQSVIDKKNFYARKRRGYNLCTECYPIGDSSSLVQLKLTEELSKYGLKIETNVKILEGKEIDIFFPELNIGIEVNGEYYHSSLFRDKNYHLNKKITAARKNIDLLFFWKSDIDNKFEIIMSMILNRLGKTPEKIYARKCLIKSVNSEDSKIFLNQNHMQGWCVSKYRLGLYYDNELVSIMTFGSLRKNLNSKGDSGFFELLRFCNKKGLNVIGGASKLLNHFELNNDIHRIISYANCEISNGNLYERLGFKLESLSKNNYWWYKNGTKYNRFLFRKQVLIEQGFDPDKTEDQIMNERGYLKLYGCGNLKYGKNLKNK